jgi:putative membrane protein
MTLADLPVVNALLNGLSAIFLMAGYVRIRQGRVQSHRNFMAAAFVASVLFLACYLTYHGYVAYVLHRGPTRFVEPNWFRPVYLVILITHTILAVVVVPLVLITLARALKGNFERHRAIARWTWPIWMYVSVTRVGFFFII